MAHLDHSQEEAALLAAIDAEPDEDQPRLVYADWLDRHGDPQRATLIRVQCQIANLPAGDSRRSPLKSQAQQLIREGRQRWVPSGFPWSSRVEFWRGFPERLRLSAQLWLNTRLSELSQVPSLRELDLHGAGVTDRGLRYVGRLTSLRSLDLSKCSSISDLGLTALSGLVELRQLSLGFCKQVSRDGMSWIGALQQLESLSLWGCSLRDEVPLRQIAKLPVLRSLDLQACAGVSDVGLRYVCELRKLESLDLTHCRNLSDEGLSHLTKLPTLRSLSLEGCSRLTKAAVRTLAELETLRFLNLWGCARLSHEAVGMLQEYLPETKIIHDGSR